MPQSKTSRLKVYQTHMGLHVWVVAASSQKAALDAWDIRANLFARGEASVTDDRAAVKAALGSPGKVVALDLDAKTKATLKQISTAVPKPPQRERLTKPTEKKRLAKPDRSQLDAAERRVADFDARASKTRTKLEQRKREALQTLDEIENEDDALEFEARRLKAELAGARKHFKDASK